MTDQTIRLTIDGQEVCCPVGWTIYQAATAAGIHIPIFCHYCKLTPVGACRTCMVEIDGVRGLQTSCTTPVREGMVVRVHTSPAAVKQRRAVLEFLLTNHPLDCPVCDKGGECTLQDQAMLDGPGGSRYVEEKRHKNKHYPLGELIVLDQERCVLCWRCIRFLDEWADDHELDLFGRGATTRLDTFPGRSLSSKWQGNTIDICPVGALTSRVFRFQARVWELINTPSICPLCPVGCNITLGVKNNELRRVVPRENSQVNDTWICDRGRFGNGFVDHADRLTMPLVRHNGQLEPATWDQALDLIARRFGEIRETHQLGPQAIAGLGSTRIANEANYLFQRFMRIVVGTNSVDHLGRMPVSAIPLASLPDLEQRDVILLLGFDPSIEAPLVELWIKKAVQRHQARVVVAHPRRIELARYGGPWLGYLPGGEAALLDSLARSVAALRSQPADAKPGDGGAPAHSVRQAAQLLAQAKRPIALFGPTWGGVLAGSTRPLGGIDVVFVAEDNNTLGALQTGVAPDLLPGLQLLDDKTRNRVAGLWGGKLSPLKGLDFDGMVEAAGQGALEAMWIVGCDPAVESRMAAEALRKIQFLVVQDLFMSETASMAEVVLPAASFAESEGSFVNLTGRWQAIRSALRSPGQARPDWWIIAEVARRMVGDKRRKAWEFAGPADILAEISKVAPGYRVPELSAMGAEGWQPPASGLQRKSDAGRAPAASRQPQAALPSRAEQQSDSAGGPRPPSADHDYPLTLVTGRLLYDRGTLLCRSDPIQQLVPEAFVMIHPTEAARQDLADGDRVWVVSAEGRLEFTLRVSDEIVPGAAFVPLNLSATPLSVLLPAQGLPGHVRITK